MTPLDIRFVWLLLLVSLVLLTFSMGWIGVGGWKNDVRKNGGNQAFVGSARFVHLFNIVIQLLAIVCWSAGWWF